jgi:uncharacterized membrane protein
MPAGAPEPGRADGAKPAAKAPVAPSTIATRLLAVYQRLVSLALLGLGLVEWSALLGVDAVYTIDILAMPPPEQAATLFFVVIDLVAAVGLWLGAAWGVAIWLFLSIARVGMHTALASTFGFNPVLAGGIVVSVVVYFVLVVLARREEKAMAEFSRIRRRQEQV